VTVERAARREAMELMAVKERVETVE